ncbi:MAG: hypothetical protein RLZZ262_2634 [Bacteroidota bacterium]|jgi:uncharacterized protein (DUF2141 family)
MKSCKQLFVLCAALFALTSNAQTNHDCASDHLNDSLMIHNQGFSRSYFYMEQKLAQMSALNEADRTNDIYSIPVVVHIIHEGEPYGTGSNISDEQIFSAIEALNEDFRHMAGTNGYGDGPDIGIEFCLAARTPTGTATNGILRVNGSSVTNYSTMGIEASGGNGADEAAVKALSTWPRDQYMNIWVVNEIENNDAGNGIQGYAYFPFNSPLDGIVILHNAFGTVGNVKSNTDMNRTLTHEVGHFFGLYHTFHDTSSCTGESSCSTQGDRVCDTPVTIQSASCTNPACSGTQQVENYMDYTPETCQNMFSEGQKLRMRTTLETQRTTLLSSLGCMPVFTRDAGITAILSPTGTGCAGGVSPQVTLTNFGSSAITTVAILYNVDGGANSTFNWTGNLASGASTTVTLGSINPSSGDHTLYAWTNNPNGQSDQNTSNDQSNGTFSISTGAPAILTVTLDYFGSETTWNISQGTTILLTGGPYVNNQQGLQVNTNICLSAGCYTLTMLDQYGDGQGFTNGSYALTSPTGTVLANGSGNWGADNIHTFCLEDTTPVGTPPVASMTIQDNSVCRNAQVDFTSTSTNSPTSYLWTFEGGTPSTSTSANPQNIIWAAAGTYDVTLTATNAYGSNTYTCANCMTIFAGSTVTLSTTQPLCSTGNTGAILSNVSGTSPYTYSWSNNATTSNLTNLAPGSYTVTVTDGNGCTTTASSTLTAPSAVTISGTATQPGCSSGGSITVTTAGGTGTRTVTWSNGATGNTISNLQPGSYTATVTDANGCTASTAFSITSVSSIVIAGSVTPISCPSFTNGAIAVTASGGTGNKTFSWSNGATGGSISNLPAGTYTVTATDAAGCTATQSFTVIAPSAIVLTGTVTNVTCNGGTNGSITVNATGGTGNKTFSWSNGMTGASISNLTAGTYNVTVTDANGCIKLQSYTVTQPSQLVTNLSEFDIACGGEFGTAQMAPTGGTSPYTYSWSSGGNASTASNLSTGEYTATVTDVNNCTASTSFSITAQAGLSVVITKMDLSCNGSADGSATALCNGGTGVYTYEWNTGAVSSSISGLSAGSYGVTVVDSEGCQGTASTIIEEPIVLSVAIFKQDEQCFNNNNGTATATAIGGVAPYSYQWSNGETTAFISGLAGGVYNLIVTDANGCMVSESIEIESAQLMIASTMLLSEETCEGNNGSALLSIEGGSPGYFISWSNGSNNTLLDQVAAGTYIWNATDVNGCTMNGQVLIPYNCVVDIAPTQLTDEYCNATDVAMSDIIYCNPVDGASMYLWRFVNSAGALVSDEYSLGTAFYTSQIPGVQSGMYYAVMVKALVGEDWGPFGATCGMTIAGQTEEILPGLIAEDCGTIITEWGHIIHSVIVPNAINYQWHITGPNYDWTTFTTNPILAIESAMQLELGNTYDVQMRCAMGNYTFTEWGEPCSFTVEVVDNVEDMSGWTGIVSVYPNPNNGELLHFNIPPNTIVKNIELFGMNGQIVQRFTTELNSMQGQQQELRFIQTLPTGIYILRYEFNGILNEEKLMVQRQ